MRTVRRQAGFGLIDAAAGATVLAVGLLAALAAVSVGTQLGRANAETRAATQAAAFLLDEVRDAPFADLITVYAGSTRPLDTLGEGLSSGQARIEITEAATGNVHWPVYLVVVRVEFTGVSGTREIELASYVAERVVEGIPL